MMFSSDSLPAIGVFVYGCYGHCSLANPPEVPSPKIQALAEKAAETQKVRNVRGMCPRIQWLISSCAETILYL